MKIKVFFSVAFIIFFSFLFVKFLFLNGENDNLNGLVAVDTVTKEFSRTFTEQEAVYSIHFTDSASLKVPASIQLVDSTVYISDFSDFSIYNFHQDGTLVQKLKTGVGNGPGEFNHLSGYDIINGSLWAVDQANLRVSSFDLDSGEFYTNFSVQKRPWRITTLHDGLVIMWLGSDQLFTKFDFEGKEITRFGEIAEDQLQNPLSFDGEIASNRNDLFVYVPRYASLIYVYSSSGELKKVIQAPDGRSFQQTIQIDNVYQAPTVGNKYVMLDPVISDDNILSVYVAGTGEQNLKSTEDGKPIAMIDMYDLNEGIYLNSIILPFNHEIGKYDSENRIFFSTTAYEGNIFKTKF